MSPGKLSLASLLLATGCIGSSPDKPTLTAAEHESEARRAEQHAQEQMGRRDPSAYSIQRCGPPVGTPAVLPPPGVPNSVGANANVVSSLNPCSASTVNLDLDHEREAERLRWTAAKHRDAAARLRSREARACYGLDDYERTANLLEAPDQLLAVQEMPDHSGTGKAASQRGGATLLLAPAAGQSAEQVERMLVCRAASAGVSGRDELESSPLTVPGAKTAVIQTDEGFLVEVSADDRKTAQEIARRAKALDGSLPR